ncbi:sucrose transport protein SUT4-like isoform X2 [Asparagus officinalis]|uniref:sucrose transport protein SUT4-like isoform X2 n=1 Tax=Asparagus officinalis TaxID=4686 RepID=UPI00098E0CCF|nr:sucrose transport protein SUT4-like isoform X2 [Asparagus officinalis]
MDAVSIRVPYHHLERGSELELVDIDGRGESTSIPISSPSYDSPGSKNRREEKGSGLRTLVMSCMVGAGVQFGWALQLSLLTPYVQTLGIQHAFSSFIWLCGPITGLIVQPCVGIWSDKCRLKLGRRRPFILAGCVMISFAVTLIGFSADVGYILGDTNEDCKIYKGPRLRATIIFVMGFWMLDLANNTVQGPARALLADLSGPDQCNSANAIFCSWMAVGNILGYSAGASGQWTRWFPFLKTKACCEACANLKAAFLVAVAFLLSCMSVTLYFAKEVPLEAKSVQHLSDSAPLLKDSQHHSHGSSWTTPGKQENGHDSEYVVAAKTNSNGHSNFDLNSKHDKADAINAGPSAVLVNLLTSLRHLPPGMHSVLLVMALTWTSWFPFFLFDTDWMGREVYHGNPNGNTNEIFMYQNGVREGAFGLLLNSVVLGISSFLIDPMCRKMGSKIVWAMSNFIVFICMAATTIISFVSLSDYSNGIQHVLGANNAIKIATLVIFSLLGFPLAITYSVPFSVTAELTAGTGGGQGLATGVLNLAIVIPQMLVSLGAGPWDALFGGGNIPAFFLAAAFSLAGGIIAILKLPKLSNSYTSSGFHGFG